MRLPDVDAVAFDAVGTLIHPSPSAAEVYTEVGRRFGSNYTIPNVQTRFRRAFARQEELDRCANLRTCEEREIERWRSIVGEVLDDVSDLEACFRELFEHFSKPEAWRCDPDTASTLQALHRRRYLLGLAS